MHTGNWSKTMRRTGSHRHAVKGNTQAAVTHRTQSHTGTGTEAEHPSSGTGAPCPSSPGVNGAPFRGKLCNWRFWPVGLQEMQTGNQRPVAHASRRCS